MAYPRYVRRIERLINLIAALLETQRPLTAEDIRRQIAGYDQDNREAFRRAFERDKEALRSMGIPLELVTTDPLGDDGDGYVIPKEKYYLPELDLEPDELAALSIAAGAVLGAGPQAASGMMKLSLDLPQEGWNGPQVVWGTDLAAEQPLLGPLYAAVSEREAISFEHAGTDGTVVMRELEPYGLVHRRGNWYVVGRDTSKDAIRGFKVSRLGGTVERLGRTFSPPEDFRPADHLDLEAWEVGPEPVPARVRFGPDFRWWAEQNMAEPKTAGPDGSLDIELSVANADALISWVIGFGGRVQIVSPAELRKKLVDHVAPFAVRADA